MSCTIRRKIYKEPLYEMARVGFISSGNKQTTFDVFVRTDDPGNVPHVHIQSKNKKFKTCIRLDTNKYFLHGEWRDMFNTKQCKLFNNFMRSTCNDISRYENATMYEFAIDMWNKNNSKRKIDIKRDNNNNVIIPDYNSIQK